MESCPTSSDVGGAYSTSISSAPLYSIPYSGSGAVNTFPGIAVNPGLNVQDAFSYHSGLSGLTNAFHNPTGPWASEALMPDSTASLSHLSPRWQHQFGVSHGLPIPEEWSPKQGFSPALSAPHHQSPLLASIEPQTTEPVPGCSSSPSTPVSSGCDTPPDLFSTMEDFKPTIQASSPIDSLSHTPFLHDGSLTSAHMFQSLHSPPMTVYDSLGAMFTSAGSPQMMPAMTFGYGEAESHEVLPEPFQGDELEADTDKIKAMDEKTKLVRKRHPKNQSSTYRPVCELCNAQFSRRHNLVQHQLTKHSDVVEKPYKCYTCEHAFSREADLKRHVESVSQPTYFPYE
jgi:hypothetical protein